MNPSAIRLRGGERVIPEEFDGRAYVAMNERLDDLAAIEPEPVVVDEMEPCS